MVEVFKTDIQEANASNRVVCQLLAQFPGSRITFDLEDCDKILRVESTIVASETIILLLNNSGYQCQVLC